MVDHSIAAGEVLVVVLRAIRLLLKAAGLEETDFGIQ